MYIVRYGVNADDVQATAGSLNIRRQSREQHKFSERTVYKTTKFFKQQTFHICEAVYKVLKEPKIFKNYNIWGAHDNCLIDSLINHHKL